jgi:hypothetical protein
MFRRPHISLTLSNSRQERTDDNNTPASNEIDWDVVGQKAAIFQETAETVAKVVVGLYVAKKLTDTVSQISIIAAQSHFAK